MMRLSKFSAATVLGLVLGLALFTTGAFAQSGSQHIEHGNISASAHAVVVNSIIQAGTMRESARQGPQDASGNCGNWGWGDNCGGGFTSCGSQRECRTVQECRWSRWGRVCRGYKICRFRSICRQCSNNGWNGGYRGGWNGGSRSWAVKQH